MSSIITMWRRLTVGGANGHSADDARATSPRATLHAPWRMYTPRMKRSPDLVDLFQALGDPTRLRILNLLAAGELCVCYFVEILGDPQPKISRHLAYLRRAGVVDARR